MIFAAGLGTRLKPVTETIPKALVEVGGIPMIERVIHNLVSAGVTDIIINLHHFPEKIKHFIASKNQFNINISYSLESGQLLETGGGLMKAAHFFDNGKPFIVHNADILTNLDITEMIKNQHRNNSLATLFVQQRTSTRYLLFNNNNLLRGWVNKNTGEKIDTGIKMAKFRELAFNGIHIIDPKIFGMIKRKGSFSIIPVYLELAKTQNIMAFEKNTAYYLDIGKPESLKKAKILVRKID